MEVERWGWERHVGDKVAPSFELVYCPLILVLSSHTSPLTLCICVSIYYVFQYMLFNPLPPLLEFYLARLSKWFVFAFSFTLIFTFKILTVNYNKTLFDAL